MFRTDRMLEYNPELEPNNNNEFSGATLQISNEGETDLSLVKYQLPIETEQKQGAILTEANLKSEPSVKSNESEQQQDKILNEANSISKPSLKNNEREQTEGRILTVANLQLDPSLNNFLSNEDPEECEPNDEDPTPSASIDLETSDLDSFFSSRSGQFERAVADISNKILQPNDDSNILGKWLLTEVSHWDHEHERIYVLTSKSLYEVKYDFINLAILKHFKINLEEINVILRGKLTYPKKSLVPKLKGITNGISSLVYSNLFPIAANQKRRKENLLTSSESCLTVSKRFDFSSFNPIERKDLGIRILWNQGKNLSILESWNPIAKIPWKTIKDHPLYSFDDPSKSVLEQEELDKIRYRYSFDSLYNALVGVFSGSTEENLKLQWEMIDGPILMENYIGIGALIHNKNNLGFFKCRGKFSF